jgi:hypothetical protein
VQQRQRRGATDRPPSPFIRTAPVFSSTLRVLDAPPHVFREGNGEKQRHAVVAQQVADATVSDQVWGTVEVGEFCPHRSLPSPFHGVRPDFRNAEGRVGYRGRIHFAFDALEDSPRAVTTLGNSPDLRPGRKTENIVSKFFVSSPRSMALNGGKPRNLILPSGRASGGDWPRSCQSSCARGADFGRMQIQS